VTQGSQKQPKRKRCAKGKTKELVGKQRHEGVMGGTKFLKADSKRRIPQVFFYGELKERRRTYPD